MTHTSHHFSEHNYPPKIAWLRPGGLYTFTLTSDALLYGVKGLQVWKTINPNLTGHHNPGVGYLYDLAVVMYLGTHTTDETYLEILTDDGMHGYICTYNYYHILAQLLP